MLIDNVTVTGKFSPPANPADLRHPAPTDHVTRHLLLHDRHYLYIKRWCSSKLLTVFVCWFGSSFVCTCSQFLDDNDDAESQKFLSNGMMKKKKYEEYHEEYVRNWSSHSAIVVRVRQSEVCAHFVRCNISRVNILQAHLSWNAILHHCWIKNCCRAAGEADFYNPEYK